MAANDHSRTVYRVMRVLVADESRTMRTLVMRAVRQAGFDAEFIEAADGSELLRTLSHTPGIDLVLTEWYFPGRLSGFDVLKTIRERDMGTPWVFITVETHVQAVEDSIALGAQAHLGKPFHPDQIVEVIRQVVAEARAAKTQPRPHNSQGSR
jgi:two-component system chemotaxis response regulator CheY